MKIYRGKIKPISEDVVSKLTGEGDVEIAEDQVPEVILDIEAIIKEYLRMEEEISSQDPVAGYELPGIRKTAQADRRGEGF